MPRVDAVVLRVLELLTETQEHVANFNELYRVACDEAIQVVEEQKEKVQETNAVKGQVLGVEPARVGARHRARNRTFVHDDALANAIVKIGEAKADLRQSKTELAKLKEKVDGSNLELGELRKMFSVRK